MKNARNNSYIDMLNLKGRLMVMMFMKWFTCTIALFCVFVGWWRRKASEGDVCNRQGTSTLSRLHGLVKLHVHHILKYSFDHGNKNVRSTFWFQMKLIHSYVSEEKGKMMLVVDWKPSSSSTLMEYWYMIISYTVVLNLNFVWLNVNTGYIKIRLVLSIVYKNCDLL